MGKEIKLPDIPEQEQTPLVKGLLGTIEQLSEFDQRQRAFASLSSAQRRRGVNGYFYAVYGEHNTIFDIKTLEIIEGDLPARARKLVVEWAVSD